MQSIDEIVKKMPPQNDLVRLFDYDQETGKIYRKPLTEECADIAWRMRERQEKYNSTYAGREAFAARHRSGYLCGKVFGTNYMAHRIIWKLVHGEDPVAIDHINGDRADNRLINLRACTNAENSRNYKKPHGGSSKYRGVCWVKRDQAWAARISVGVKKISLGYHQDEIAAAKAYDRAAREHHGEFAILNFPGVSS